MTARAGNDPTPIPEGLDEALQDLAAVIDLLETGYNRLSPLIRSLAAGVLHKKTGMTLPEWRAWTAEMGETVRGIGQAGPDERCARVRVLLAREDRDQALEALAACARSVPEQAVRFTNNQDLLDELAQGAAEQEKRIQRARDLLRILAAPKKA